MNCLGLQVGGYQREPKDVRLVYLRNEVLNPEGIHRNKKTIVVIMYRVIKPKDLYKTRGSEGFECQSIRIHWVKKCVKIPQLMYVHI